MTSLVIPASPLSTELAAARTLARASRSTATRRAYDGDWRAFVGWAEARGVDPLPAPPEAVAAYLAHLDAEGLSVATIGLALVAISQAHRVAGLESPRSAACVRETMTGLARTRGTAPSRRAPLTAEQLRAVLAALPSTVAGTRDRAMLLVGWNLAMRRSALVALDVADVTVEPWGAVVTIRRDKTDQLGAGRQVPLHRHGNVELCPVAALQAWLRCSGGEGAIFRSVDRKGRVGSSRLTDRSVALIVKTAVERVGLAAELYAGHSLRAGVVTSAAQAGRGIDDIMALTGHRSVAVARGYIRRATVRDVGAARGLL